MKNDTIAGFYNLPVRNVTAIPAVYDVLQVPAAGVYPGLPSPVLPVGSAISIGLNDIVGSNAFDGHPFKICVSANVLNATGAQTFNMSLYQLPAAQIGQIGATAPITAAGVVGTGVNTMGIVFTTVAVTGGTARIRSETLCIWDSTSLQLSSIHTYRSWVMTGANSNFVAIAAGTSIANVASISDLNFTLGFGFSAVVTTKTVQVTEFTIERV